MSKNNEKFWDLLGEILALVLLVVYAVLILDANFHFLPSGKLMEVLQILRTYGSFALVGVVGFEAITKRGFIFKLIFLLMVALVVVFMFFPQTYDSLIKAVVNA